MKASLLRARPNLRGRLILQRVFEHATACAQPEGAAHKLVIHGAHGPLPSPEHRRVEDGQPIADGAMGSLASDETHSWMSPVGMPDVT